MNPKNETQGEATPASWEVRKIAQIASDHQKSQSLASLDAAYYQLELEALTTLAGELKAFPALAVFIPKSTAAVILTGSTAALSTLERAAFILVENDARTCAVILDKITDASISDFLKIKWAALGRFLEGASNE